MAEPEPLVVRAVDVGAVIRSHAGAAWAHEGTDLDVTMLSWGPGRVVADHVNDMREVLLVCLSGSGVARVDGIEYELAAGSLLVIPRGARRSILAGPGGLAYVSAHVARGPLQLTPRRAPDVPAPNPGSPRS